jgi:Leucine-rich repeat (LRR) protein
MPGLDILDMSKNQLRAFPDQPGRLIHIRVLSITNNKLVTLPSYLTKFEDLQVFKVDNNPIEWPVS